MKDKFFSISGHEELALFFGMTYKELARIIYGYDDRFKYVEFEIPKRGGGSRLISAPSKRLKKIQTNLKDVLYEIYRDKPSVHGFVKRKSIVSNAQSHLDKRYVFNLDLEGYFSSIHFGRVRNLFQSEPFGFRKSVATILAQICCFNNSLPQGAPTSPIIANMISFKLDSQLQSLAKRTNATYTRYADDITFSFTCKKSRISREVVVLEEDAVKPGMAVSRIINENGFFINHDKIRLSGIPNRMEVTGLTVNEFPNVTRSYIKQLSSMIYAWETFGYDAAEAEFQKKYDYSYRASEEPKSFKYVVKGKLAFLRNVRGSRDLIFTKLAQRFNKLVEKELKFVTVEESNAEKSVATALWVIETCYEYDGGVKAAQGTGFDLESFGVVTCAHVVSDKDGLFKEIKAFKSSDPTEVYDLKVHHLDEHRDIALCDLFDELGNVAPLSPLLISAKPAEQRDAVTLLGFPQYAVGKNQHYVVDAKIASAYVLHGVQKFEIDQLIREGNSGGPVINQAGEVVGVATEGATKSSGNNSVLSIHEVRSVFSDLYKKVE